MSASAEAQVNRALERARVNRALLESAVATERRTTVAFMDEALNCRWSWPRIGGALGVSATGARRYYERNRRRARAA